jgi:hypothetical protein
LTILHEQESRQRMDLTLGRALGNALMWKVNGRVLGSHIVNQLLQTVQERHHSKVEAAIVQQTAQVEVA